MCVGGGGGGACVRACVRACVCVSVHGMNLKYALRWHIHCISVHSVLCQCYTQAHAHTHPQTIFENSEPTGLKADIVVSFRQN